MFHLVKVQMERWIKIAIVRSRRFNTLLTCTQRAALVPTTGELESFQQMRMSRYSMIALGGYSDLVIFHQAGPSLSKPESELVVH